MPLNLTLGSLKHSEEKIKERDKKRREMLNNVSVTVLHCVLYCSLLTFTLTEMRWFSWPHQPSALKYFNTIVSEIFKLKSGLCLAGNTSRCVTVLCVSSFLFLLLQCFFQLTTATLQSEYNCMMPQSLSLPICAHLSAQLSVHLSDCSCVCLQVHHGRKLSVSSACWGKTVIKWDR